MKLWRALFIALALFAALFAGFYFLRSHPGGERAGILNKTAWQRMASPGALSQAHTFLEHNCAACHTSVKGVEAVNCIVCHANNTALLQRQPTAFHANIGSCIECHLEHRGVNQRPTQMDHAALATIGLRQLKTSPDADNENRVVAAQLTSWLDQAQASRAVEAVNPHISAKEMILNCAACHQTKDHHFGLFGNNCAECHATDKWTIPEFRHPPPTSLDCAQCHQAPPSHYMMHFKMISMKVAGMERAQVNQCFLCHQTTAWNDIKGVGFYKHH